MRAKPLSGIGSVAPGGHRERSPSETGETTQPSFDDPRVSRRVVKVFAKSSLVFCRNVTYVLRHRWHLSSTANTRIAHNDQYQKGSGRF